MRRTPASPAGRHAFVGLLLFVALGTSPVRADWLVTRLGERIETRGAWQERGKLVVFSRSDGTLVSMRLAELDLEASRAATRKATEGAGVVKQVPGKAEGKRATIQLSDKDFQHTAIGAEPQKEGEAGAAVEKEKPKALAVVAWDRKKSPQDGHVVLLGTLRNTSSQQVTSAGITVRLFDGQGEPLGTQEAQLAATVLPPGGTARFEADFPNLYAFGSAKFETKSVDLGLKQGSPAAIPTKPKLVFSSSSPPPGPNR